MVNAKSLIGDSLYQLNLILWLVQPCPGEASLPVPVFKQAGFSLHSIERPLHLPLDVARRIHTASVRISDPVSPEALLNNKEEAAFITLECKRTMFGAEPHTGDSPHKQARALLLQTAAILAGSLAQPSSAVQSNHLLYITRHQEPKNLVTDGLGGIADDLQFQGYATVLFGVLGLDIEGTNIVLRHDYPRSTLPPCLSSQLTDSFVKIQALEAETDPRPIYYMPWLPDSESEPDDYARRSFAHRILGQTVIRIGTQIPPSEVVIVMDELLNEATFGMWQKWRNNECSKRLRNEARTLVRDAVKRSAPELEIRSMNEPSRLEFRLPSDKFRQRLIEGLRKIDVGDWHKPQQITMFVQEE